jgi:Tol biopolymer transport system component
VAWSRDGRWLLLRTDNATAGAGDIVGLRTTGDTTPVSLVSSGFTELHPALSPDGRWLAYTSNESGINEVYVRPFPATDGGRWQVSNAGGVMPVWAPNGRELYFVNGTVQLAAAPVAAGPLFSAGTPRSLFDVSAFALDPFQRSYDVSPDGRFFVFVSPLRSSGGSSSVRMVQVDNWLPDIRARLRQ